MPLSVNFGPRGNGQINFWVPTLGVDFPFINHLKMALNPFTPNGTPTEPFEYMRANGIPSAFPSGSTEYVTNLYIYITDDDDWILDWEGTGTCILSPAQTSVTLNQDASTSNSKTYSTTSARPVGHIFPVQVKITSIGSGFDNVRLYRASHQSLLNGGQKWNPDFITLYKGYGRLRMMDMGGGGISMLRRWEDRTTDSMMSWIGMNVQTANYAGKASQSGHDYTGTITLPGDPTTLEDGQLVQAILPGSLTFKTVTNVTSENNPTATCEAHGFSDGDIVFFHWAPGSVVATTANFATATDGRFFTVADATTDTFTVSGLDSTGFTAWSGTASVAEQVTFATGNLPRKPLVYYNLGSIFPTSIDTSIFNSGLVIHLVYNELVDAYQTRAQHLCYSGLPYELQVEMANILGSKLWICVPAGATDDFNVSLATLVKENLNRELRPTVVEYCNETWNFGTHANGWCVSQARRRFGLLGRGFDSYTGWAFYQMATAWESVFTGDTRDQIDLNIAVWTADYFGLEGTVKRFEGTGTGLSEFPCAKADSISIAPYVESIRGITSQAEMIWKYKQGGTDADEAVAFMDAMARNNNNIDWNSQTSFVYETFRDTIFPAWEGWAANPADGVTGLKLRMYEGGWGYIPYYNPAAGEIASLSWSGGTATVTTVEAHERTGTFTTSIFGTSRTGYFVWTGAQVTATVTGANTFTYPLASDPGGSATGGWFTFGGSTLRNGFNNVTAVYNGEWLSTYSTNISNAVDNGAGLIRLTVTTTEALQSGTEYYVENLWGVTGFTNGYYEVDVINSTTVDLVGTSFAGTFGGNNSAFSKSRIVSDRQRLYEAYARSDLYAQFMRDLIAAYEDVGGIEYSQYPIAGAWDDNTMWGTINVGATGTVETPHVTFRAYNDATA